MPGPGLDSLKPLILVNSTVTGNTTTLAAGVTTDQRGVARLQGTGCDIGAVEVVVEAPVPSPAVVSPRFTG